MRGSGGDEQHAAHVAQSSLHIASHVPRPASRVPHPAFLWDPVLNKGAIWTYWRGAYRDTGRDEGATMVLQTADKHGWFWYIPLHDDIVSVGVVAPFDYLFKHRKGSHKVWAPMEALYAPGKQAIPSWQEGLVPDQVPEKANQLILPESPRPHDTHGH